MKVISIILNGEEKTWVADKTTKLAKIENEVQITYKHADYGKLTTVIDLTKVPLYTYG